jgi:hypothetical protein
MWLYNMGTAMTVSRVATVEMATPKKAMRLMAAASASPLFGSSMFSLNGLRLSLEVGSVMRNTKTAKKLKI